MEKEINPVYKIENSTTIAMVDLASILYTSYSRQTSFATITFIDDDRNLMIYMTDSEFMNFITRWKRWKIDMANMPQQALIF